MHRRSLIAHMALTLAASTLPASARAGPARRIIVVGAGMAGLAAAHRLTAAGHEVVVLEARERIGGRIWTSRLWPDAPLDLGASWIHGTHQNPLSRLADSIGAPRVATSYERAALYHSGGPVPASLGRRLEHVAEAMAEALAEAQDGAFDVSLRDAISGLAHDPTLVEHLLNSVFELEYAGSADELSAYWVDDGAAFDGDDVLFPQGYGTLIEALATGLEIHRAAPVTEIAWGSRPLRVVTSTQVWEADDVVVTLPLGVLKAGAVRFTPALPAAHRQAILALGMGRLDKCCLRFDEPFWPPDIDWLSRLGAGQGLWQEWLSLTRSLDLPVLVGFNAAEAAASLEILDDTAIVAGAMAALRDMFGTAIPPPTGAQITRWGRDPFAGGAYSFNALGAHPVMRDQLAEPLAPHLVFAGEATHRRHFGTVHGAYLSGLAAADRLLSA